LILDPDEAPVRKLVHELFAKEKRKLTVAKILNERGFRTRRGEEFSYTSVARMLTDPIVKGMRRVNYTESTGDGKKWKLKPTDEWIFNEVPRIISNELWETCNSILENISTKNPVRKKGIHLFSGVLYCECKTKMYMRSKSPKYVCPNCKNKVDPNDLEKIFHNRLETFLFSDTEIQDQVQKERLLIKDKEALLEAQKREFQALKQKVSNILDLYHEGKLPMDAFEEYHSPVYQNQIQVEQSMMVLQGQIDSLWMQSLDNVQVLSDAQNLHKQWNTFTQEEKKNIIETITISIVVGREDMEINLNYYPILTPEKIKSKSIACRDNYNSASNKQYKYSPNPQEFVA
jgi:site-specific DNA recombinase